MTPVWEDGASSTARESALNRANAERLNQTEILWSMIRPGTFPKNDFLDAWKNVVLFSEHTWGAAFSGPRPEAPFTIELWNGKKMFADSAEIQSKRFFNESISKYQLTVESKKYIQVINTNLWHRTDVVTIEEKIDLNGKILESESGELIPVQRVNDDRWIFIAKDVPPLSSAVYKIITDKRKGVVKNSMIRPNGLDNGVVKLKINTKTGAISSFSIGIDTFNYAAKEGLNSYLYSGRI